MYEDFPKTLLEFEQSFSTEEACFDYLLKLRWPNGFVCPRCAGSKHWRASRARLICTNCRHQASVTAGTIFQDSHKPLKLWFHAIWHVTSQKNGVSALGLQRVLGLGSYLTAWTWLHKLRRAMVRPGRDRLKGCVEVDETFVGMEDEPGVDGRRTERKSLVVIATEEDGHGIGRIRMASIPGVTKASLHAFIKSAVEAGSAVHTDGCPSYRGLGALGYNHKATVLLGKEKDAAVRLLPRVHRVAGLLKRWLLGTHQGAVRAEHLDYYLDEFTFRFNRRTARSRGKLFYRLMQQAAQIEPAPYTAIVGGKTAPTAN
jgi:transposase-like protein